MTSSRSPCPAPPVPSTLTVIRARRPDERAPRTSGSTKRRAVGTGELLWSRLVRDRHHALPMRHLLPLRREEGEFIMGSPRHGDARVVRAAQIPLDPGTRARVEETSDHSARGDGRLSCMAFSGVYRQQICCRRTDSPADDGLGALRCHAFFQSVIITPSAGADQVAAGANTPQHIIDRCTDSLRCMACVYIVRNPARASLRILFNLEVTNKLRSHREGPVAVHWIICSSTLPPLVLWRAARY